MSIHKDRYGQNGVKELTEILEKLNAFLGEHNAEIDYYNCIQFIQNEGVKALITVQLK